MSEHTKAERDYAMFTHLSPLAGFVVPWVGFVIAPLVMWLIKRDESPFLERVGREALNMQITAAIAIGACIVGAVVTLGIGLIVLIPAMGVIAIADLVFIILATVAASRGEEYRFPYCLRLVKGPAGEP